VDRGANEISPSSIFGDSRCCRSINALAGYVRGNLLAAANRKSRAVPVSPMVRLDCSKAAELIIVKLQYAVLN
jgi:hypothetical protein